MALLLCPVLQKTHGHLQHQQVETHAGTPGLSDLLCIRLSVRPQSHWLLPAKNPQAASCWKLLNCSLALEATHLLCIPRSDNTGVFVA